MCLLTRVSKIDDPANILGYMYTCTLNLLERQYKLQQKVADTENVAVNFLSDKRIATHIPIQAFRTCRVTGDVGSVR